MAECEGKKRVVIIGGGISGALVAKNLLGHANVTLVDPKEYFSISWAGLRAMVEPSFGERTLINYSEFLPGIQLVTSYAADITVSEVVTTHGDRVAYDYLVIATGHEDTSPASREEKLSEFQRSYDKIKASKSVLIAGGGPTGVELAAEIATEFPGKKVTLVHRGTRLLEFIGPKAAQKALDWLISNKVEVILDQSVHMKMMLSGASIQTSHGETITADCQFDCTGMPIGSSWLRDTILKSSLDIQGRIAVDDKLRVKGYKNIFAVGDVTNVSEIKQGFYAMKHADVAVKNLKLLLGGKNEEKMLATYSAGRPIAFVSLGRWYVVAQIFCFTISGRLPGMIKSGDLFVKRTRKRYGL